MDSYNATDFPNNSSTEFGTTLSAEFGTTVSPEFSTTFHKSTDFPLYSSTESLLLPTTEHFSLLPITEQSSWLPTSEHLLSVSPSGHVEFVFNNFPERVFLAVVMILASTIGIFGNSLVILAVTASRKLRTITNVFVVNLAVADLLVCLTLPWNAVALIAVDGWPLPKHLCSSVAGILFVSVGCSVYTLASIALNRWIVITQPQQIFQRVFKPKLLCPWIALTWLLPFVGTIIPPLLGFGELGYNHKYGTCSNVSKAPNSDEYDILSAMIIYPIPLIIIVVSYVKTFLHVRRHSVQLAQHKDKVKDRLESRNSFSLSEDVSTSYDKSKPNKISFEMNDTIVSTVSDTSNNDHSESNSKHPGAKTKENGTLRNKSKDGTIGKTPQHDSLQRIAKSSSNSRSSSVRAKIQKRFTKSRFMTIRPHLSHREVVITKNMFYIVVVFLVCLSPFAFCLFIDSSDPAIPYAATIVFFNSCLNPIVYATKHPHFKKIFGLLIKCRLRDVPAPSGCLKAVLNSFCGSEESYV